MQADLPNSFYLRTKRYDDFADMADEGNYVSLPSDWWVGTSDIAGSTQAVADGKYKTVNMIAAAVISAQINAHDGAPFPYIFGGDGAGFAIPPEWRAQAAIELANVRCWAREEFGLELRIGLVQVKDIQAAGFDISIARYRVSEGADYAMFTGGGLCWAEEQMKAGLLNIPEAQSGANPNLTGLSCRWSHMPSRNGTILSLVMLPADNPPGPQFARVAQEIAELVGHLDRSGHPAELDGPGVKWPNAGSRLEAHAQRQGRSLLGAQCKSLFESLLAWILIKTGLKLGGFDARRYRRVVGQNADFRKFEDGLKMTLDCDPVTETQLRFILQKGVEDGAVRFGIHTQDEAMMTCIVPSIMTDDHVHFVDGAAGGYTEAAKLLKS